MAEEIPDKLTTIWNPGRGLVQENILRRFLAFRSIISLSILRITLHILVLFAIV